MARLCRLRLTAAEEECLAGELADILAYIDRLTLLETGGEAETPRPPAPREAPSGRAVAPPPALPRRRFLDNAPQHEEGFLVVPEVRVER